MNSGTFYVVDLESELALELKSRALVEVFRVCMHSAQILVVLALDCLEIVLWMFERFIDVIILLCAASRC